MTEYYRELNTSLETQPCTVACSETEIDHLLLPQSQGAVLFSCMYILFNPVTVCKE